MSNGMRVYSKLASALDAIADSTEDPSNSRVIPPIPIVMVMFTVSARTHALLTEIPVVEMDFATTLVMGERTIRISDRYDPSETPTRLEWVLLSR